MIEENKGNKIDKGIYYGTVLRDSGGELHLDSYKPGIQRNVLDMGTSGEAITTQGYGTPDNV